MMRSASSPSADSMMIGTSERPRSQRAKSSPLSPGQHQVEDEQVEMAERPDPARFAGVAHRGDAEPVPFQEARQQVSGSRGRRPPRGCAARCRCWRRVHGWQCITLTGEFARLCDVRYPSRPPPPHLAAARPGLPASAAGGARRRSTRSPRCDPDLAGIEAAAGPLPWRTRPRGFPGLLQAIVAQQISNQAAAAIWRRLAATPGALRPGGAAGVAGRGARAAGLSRPKSAHARALAEAFAAGRLSEAAWRQAGPRGAVAAIVAVRGWGRGRPRSICCSRLDAADVFPAGDLALAAAAARAQGAARPARPGCAAGGLAEPWQPWRALAARLLWHHWRHADGPAGDGRPGGGVIRRGP